MRKCLAPFITFIGVGNQAIDLSGSRMPGEADEDSSSARGEEIPTIAPVAPFNDVRNDPYFVMR